MHIAESKKPILHILYDSNYMTYWKRQNYGDSNKFSGCHVLEEGGMNKQSKVKKMGKM